MAESFNQQPQQHNNNISHCDRYPQKPTHIRFSNDDEDDYNCTTGSMLGSTTAATAAGNNITSNPTSSAAALHPNGTAAPSSYVNFNQFVLQHNLAQQPALLPLPQQPIINPPLHQSAASHDGDPSSGLFVSPYVYAPAPAYFAATAAVAPAATIPDAGFAYAAFGANAFDYFSDAMSSSYGQSNSQNQTFDMDVLVRNSNLLATANEFVPQQNYQMMGKGYDEFAAAAVAIQSNVSDFMHPMHSVKEPKSGPMSVPATTAAGPVEATESAAIRTADKSNVSAEPRPLPSADAAAAVSDGQQIIAQTAAVSLSPSQGAIRKAYTNGSNGSNNGQSSQINGNTNNPKATRASAQRGFTQQQHERGGGGGGRANNRQQQSNGWSSQDDHRLERSERSSTNWRDPPATSRRQNGNNGSVGSQQQVGAGSGRTQSQYNEERAYGNQQHSGNAGYDMRRSETSTNEQRNGVGNRQQQQQQQRSANPFARGNQQQQQQQRNGANSMYGSGTNGHNAHNRSAQQPQHNQREYQREPANQQSSSGRDLSPRTMAHYDGNTASGGPLPLSPQKKFDKKKHPEFKANRNLKASPPNASQTGGVGGLSADERLTGECSQREKLIREIDAGRLECLVCCENIKPFQSTWSCANCYHIIHLNCIIKWANSSKDESGWRCPACQHVTKAIPDVYLCFCGKTRNPQYNRNDVAHTCGELCSKTEGCTHPCTLLCHPGPCATCHAQVTRECGCGKTKRTMQCCQKEDIQCTQTCDKLLACGEHRCTLVCHAGDCVTCAEEMEHRCHCGKDRKQMACVAENNTDTHYSCRKLCNRQLSCKNHKCKRVCHPDDCGDCQLLPESVSSCPCGAQPIAEGVRKSCTDPVPLCESICQRPLKCGQPAHPHQCASKCHAGACPTCQRETAVRCRCGHMEQMVKCRLLQTRSDDARCKKRCTKKRNCGKHKCNLECCIDIDHVCPLPCTFTLSCGKHKCDQTCHKGRCQRCYRSSFVELYCECRAQVIYPPVPCGSKRPTCDRPCSRQHGCTHPVTHNCHATAQCPPCMAFVTVRCYGGHEERKTIPCSQGEFSCGLKCGKGLRCGRHKCLKTCHAGECEPLEGAELCKQPCQKLRVMCGHRCLAPCHTGDCPETACREQVEVLCQCGHRKAQRTCQEFANEYRRIASAKFATTMEHMQQGGAMVELSDVLGPIKMSNNKTLDCSDECKVLERNRRLALGLQIRNPDTAAKYAPKYSEFAKGWARKDPQLVGSIHDKLSELVKLAKQSQQKSRSHSFPTMNWEKRQLVHEMCQAFGIESVAYDAEPNRNVVANATRDTSWLPSLSLLEVMKRESGQRRIPVPMNNAWGAKR